MPKKLPLLALAVAGGHSVAAWAAANCVARRTAFAWAARPEFKRLVAQHRKAIAAETIKQVAARLADGRKAV